MQADPGSWSAPTPLERAPTRSEDTGRTLLAFASSFDANKQPTWFWCAHQAGGFLEAVTCVHLHGVVASVRPPTSARCALPRNPPTRMLTSVYCPAVAALAYEISYLCMVIGLW